MIIDTKKRLVTLDGEPVMLSELFNALHELDTEGIDLWNIVGCKACNITKTSDENHFTRPFWRNPDSLHFFTTTSTSPNTEGLFCKDQSPKGTTFSDQGFKR